MAVVVAIAALVAIAIAPVHGPPWLTQTPRGQWFRVLSPAEGILLIAAVWAASRQLGSDVGPVSSQLSVISSKGVLEWTEGPLNWQLTTDN